MGASVSGVQNNLISLSVFIPFRVEGVPAVGRRRQRRIQTVGLVRFVANFNRKHIVARPVIAEPAMGRARIIVAARQRSQSLIAHCHCTQNVIAQCHELILRGIAFLLNGGRRVLNKLPGHRLFVHWSGELSRRLLYGNHHSVGSRRLRYGNCH